MNAEFYSQHFMSANICAPPLQMRDILIKCVPHCKAYHEYDVVLIGLSDCNSQCEYHHVTQGVCHWSTILKGLLSLGEVCGS